MAFSATVLLSTVLMLFGKYIFLLFADDPAVLDIGMEILTTLVPFYLTYVLVEILSGAIRSTGESLRPMIITGVGICLLRIVWIAVTVSTDGNLKMLLYGYPITWATTSLLIALYYIRGKWLKRRIAETSLQL